MYLWEREKKESSLKQKNKVLEGFSEATEI